MRNFGGPALGLPGLTGPTAANPFGGTPAPASAGFLDTTTIPSVHPLADPLSARRGLPEFFVPSVPDVAAFLPGGPDLHRTLAGDHPRANAFAHALGSSLVPADPSRHGRDVSQENVQRTGRLPGGPVRTVSMAATSRSRRATTTSWPGRRVRRGRTPRRASSPRGMRVRPRA